MSINRSRYVPGSTSLFFRQSLKPEHEPESS